MTAGRQGRFPDSPVEREPVVKLVPIGTGHARRGTEIGVTLAGLTVAAIVGVGLFGGGVPGPVPAPERSPGDGARTAAERSAGPIGSGTAGTGGRSGPRIIRVRSGYEVTYDRDAAHRPVILDRGALAIFGYGERVPDGAYPGTVRVAIGTPAQGAPVSGDEDFRRVYNTNVSDLKKDYLAVTESAHNVGFYRLVNGDSALELGFPDGHWTALVVHGNRAFVITATGFETIYGDWLQPARKGLEVFLETFRPIGTLFVSVRDGYQVPMPVETVAARPDGQERATPAPTDGVMRFEDGAELEPGRWSHVIAVSVGTQEQPALVTALPGAAGRPGTGDARIWAPDLAGLHAAYLHAIGDPVATSTGIRLGGEPALLIEGPGAFAATVLTVHAGRAYIISTTGVALSEPAPGFEAFLEVFEFLP